MGRFGHCSRPGDGGQAFADLLTVWKRSAADAVGAEGDGGVGGESFCGDLFAALGAIAVVSLLDPLEGRVEALALGCAPAGLRLSHRLVLERIHAGEAAYGLLVEVNDALAVAPGGVFCVEGGEARVEEGFGVGEHVTFH